MKTEALVTFVTTELQFSLKPLQKMHIHAMVFSFQMKKICMAT